MNNKRSDYESEDILRVVWFKHLLFTTYGFYFDSRLNKNRYVEEIDNEKMLGTVSFAPNPWADRAVLSYTVKQTGHVSISLFDATGRLIKNVKDEIQQTGHYILTIDNSDLAAGVYFLQATTPDETERIRTTLIR